MGWENDFHVYAMTMGTNNKYQKRQQSAQKNIANFRGEKSLGGGRILHIGKPNST